MLQLQRGFGSGSRRRDPLHRRHVHCCRSSSGFSPIAPMPANGWRTRPGSSSRLSASRPVRLASPSIPGVGWSNASWHGLGETAASQRISKERSPRQPPSSMPLPSCCSRDDWLVRFEIRVRLLAKDAVRTVLLWTAQPKALAYSMLRSVLVGGDDCYHLGNSRDCGWVAALLASERCATDDRDRSRRSDCRCESAHPFYRGVRTGIGFPPRVTSVLVPLPFCMNRPSPPEPAVVVLAADPTFPITTVGRREVAAVGSSTFWEVCATVAPIISARIGVTASKDLNMSCSPGDCLQARVLAVPFTGMGTLSRLRTVRKLLR